MRLFLGVQGSEFTESNACALLVTWVSVEEERQRICWRMISSLFDKQIKGKTSTDTQSVG